MATDRQQHKEEKSTFIRQALPAGTMLRSGIREYKVKEVLGAGGFGITYKVSANLRVDNVTLTSWFVIKEHFLKGCWRDENKTNVLHAPTMEADVKQSRKDFLEEARRLNEIGQKTPNIVKVNEVFEANGTAYYVMEYLDGGDLLHYIHKYGPLPEEKAVSLIVIVAKAVVLLHAHRLLHLDIKPDNIVLKTDPKTGMQIPVLIDFGIAKHFDKSGKPISLLVAKGASEGYAPMEQYDEIDRFAPEIDVYALGATLYFLLTGKHPPKAFNLHSFNDLYGNLPTGLSNRTITALTAAMQPSRFERTGNVTLFVENLNGEQITDNKTEIFDKKTKKKKNVSKGHGNIQKRMLLSFAALFLIVGGIYIFELTSNKKGVVQKSEPTPQTVVTPKSKPASSPVAPQKNTETDDQKYAKAVSSGDVSTLKELADKGYAKAYSKLAVLYLNNSKYSYADSYAQKAYKAGVGKQEAIEVMEKLRQLGWYDDKELPDALKLRNPQGNTGVVRNVDMELLGAAIRPVSANQKKQLGLSYGLEVTDVFDGKMAEAGIKKDFIILKADNQPMKSTDDLEKVMKVATQSPEQLLFIVGMFPSGKRANYAVDLTQK